MSDLHELGMLMGGESLPEKEQEKTPDQEIDKAQTDVGAADDVDDAADNQDDDFVLDDSDGEDGETEADPGKGEADKVLSAKEVEIALPDGVVQKVSIDALKDAYVSRTTAEKETGELRQKVQAYEAEAGNFRQQNTAVLQQLKALYETRHPITMIQRQIQEASEIGDDETANRLRFDLLAMENEYRNINAALAHEQEVEKENSSKKTEVESQGFIAEQRRLLAEKLPQVNDPEKLKNVQAAMTKALQEVGIKPEEITTPDHRNALLAYYAGLYLRGRDQKNEAANSLKGKGVVPKPSGRSARVDSRKEAAREAFRSDSSNFDKFVSFLDVHTA